MPEKLITVSLKIQIYLHILTYIFIRVEFIRCRNKK